ncbi:DUF1851 domain-containing protein [Mesorhizobium sp. B3-1-7]|uniref:T6SS immunity protein Tdi1 domain-containing protein n=1 Tax=Mesorhizobium sp. B3-1-7 TaxID=2589894 RepID=UPI00112CDE9C|nr:T6SS immunity protein Tdi1 domain-containing protein [Mesorhizobium sp. B3-1-7]TPI60445.1 DUF1851 domain-containing protein [Mesorhizobium sp. B3-1-7]
MANSFSRFISFIFGNSVSKPNADAVRSPWPSGLQHLFIEPSKKDIWEALDGWKWIGLDGLEPGAVSAFGDIFFRAPDGSVKLLDMVGGRLTQVSETWPELTTQFNDPDRRDELLLAGLVTTARKKGLVLGVDECYDFEKPPVLGGEMSVKQINKTFFVVKAHIAGQIHRHVKDLPHGTKINKVTIGDR